MVVILILLTVLAFITVELILKRREKLREATESLELGEPARIFPYRVAHELPGGLFFHSGHTWAKLEPSGTVQVGLDGFARAVNDQINSDPQGAKKEPYEKGWAVAVRPFNIVQNLKKLRIGAEASAWLEKEVRSFAEFLSLHRAVPKEVEGILETMDGEILQIAIRKFFR